MTEYRRGTVTCTRRQSETFLSFERRRRHAVPRHRLGAQCRPQSRLPSLRRRLRRGAIGPGDILRREGHDRERHLARSLQHLSAMREIDQRVRIGVVDAVYPQALPDEAPLFLENLLAPRRQRDMADSEWPFGIAIDRRIGRILEPIALLQLVDDRPVEIGDVADDALHLRVFNRLDVDVVARPVDADLGHLLGLVAATGGKSGQQQQRPRELNRPIDHALHLSPPELAVSGMWGTNHRATRLRLRDRRPTRIGGPGPTDVQTGDMPFNPGADSLPRGRKSLHSENPEISAFAGSTPWISITRAEARLPVDASAISRPWQVSPRPLLPLASPSPPAWSWLMPVLCWPEQPPFR